MLLDDKVGQIDKTCQASLRNSNASSDTDIFVQLSFIHVQPKQTRKRDQTGHFSGSHGKEN